MSISGRLIKFMMRLINVKGYIRSRTDRQLNSQSVPKPPRGVRRKHTIDEISAGGSKAFWLSKSKAANGVVVYLHGGAFVTGPIQAQWNYISDLAYKAGMSAVVIPYSKLPEHPFPAALNEVFSMVTHMLENRSINRWYFSGDSAGGNLALATTYKLKEKGLPLPRKMILMSPFLDASMSNPALQLTEDEDPLLSTTLRFGKEGYAPEEEWQNPLVSPMFGNLRGLPPILLQVGTSEVMLWDVRKFYLKCLDANVKVDYQEFKGMFHVFQLLPILPEARRARRAQLRFLLEN